MNRDSVEKRQVIAFLLFTLGQVQKPILGEPLYKKGVERAQTICGLHEFTNASIHYVVTLRTLEARIVEAVKADRDGEMAMLKDGPWQLPGFAAEHEGEIDRLVRLAANVDVAKKRLDDLTKEKDKFQAVFDQRTKHHADTKDKLIKARKTTDQYMKDLLQRQEQLHEALVELSGRRRPQLSAPGREITALEKNYNQKERQKKEARNSHDELHCQVPGACSHDPERRRHGMGGDDRVTVGGFRPYGAEQGSAGIHEGRRAEVRRCGTLRPMTRASPY